ncbi:MAG: hypothetical protein ACXWRA_13225, partial [Pseudobdellovibrionaceae bacterium]
MDKKLSSNGHSASESVPPDTHVTDAESNSQGQKPLTLTSTEGISTHTLAVDEGHLPLTLGEIKNEGKRTKELLPIPSGTATRRIDSGGRIAKSIRHKRIRDEVRRSLKTGVPTEAFRLELLDADTKNIVWSETAEYILIESDLKRKGLLKEDSEEILFSQLFELETAEVVLDQNEVKVTDETRGTFLGEDDYTDNDKLGFVDPSILFPRLSTLQIWELSRPAPSSILHQMARKIDDDEIPHRIEPSLMGYVILFSREVVALEHFEDVVTKGLGNEYPGLDYQKYLKILPTTKRQLRDCLKWYFQGSHWTLKVLGQNSNLEHPEDLSKEFWQRFFKTLDSLTPKQLHALEKVYMHEDCLTYAKAASDFKISIDSLRDRINSALVKFKKEFPELALQATPRPEPLHA